MLEIKFKVTATARSQDQRAVQDPKTGKSAVQTVERYSVRLQATAGPVGAATRTGGVITVETTDPAIAEQLAYGSEVTIAI